MLVHQRVLEKHVLKSVFDIFLQSFALSSPSILDSDTRPTQEPQLVAQLKHHQNCLNCPWPWKALIFIHGARAMSDSNVVLFWCEGRNIHHQLVWRHRAMPTHAPWAPTDLEMVRCWRLLIGTLGCPPVRSCAWRKGYWGKKQTNKHVNAQ